MKKILSLLLALTLIFAFTACGEKKGDALESGASSLTQTETEITNTESEENSSLTDVPNSSSANTEESKPTSNSKPNNNNNNNTTSSKPNNTQSTPATSHTHNWGNWITETKAIIGKDGTERRTCSSCKEKEIRSTKRNAAFNSFSDCYLDEYLAWYGNLETQSKYGFDIYALFKCGDLIARDECWDGSFEDMATATIPVDAYYNALKGHFVLNDTVISQMKSQRNTDAYPITMDGFTPQPYDAVVGYTHNGGNKYTAYYESSYNENAKPIKVELEYNLTNNKPNRYVSVEYVSSIPNNIKK